MLMNIPRIVLQKKGFTLVEILVVVTIVGILVSLTYMAYGEYKKRAMYASAQNDISQIVAAIKLARTNNKSSPLHVITGKGYPGATGQDAMTSMACYGAGDGGLNAGNVEPKTLPPADNCWVVYKESLDKISTASGVNLDKFKKGDPFGNPYYIGENESKFHMSDPCVRDVISMFVPGSPYVYLHNPGPASKPAPNAWRRAAWGVNPPATVNGVSIVDTYNVQVYIPMAQPPAVCV